MTIFLHGGEPFLFYFFSSLAILSGIMVIRARNPVHSVLFLILVFCNTSGLLILLGLDFFALVFLVVYVGAIAVLFLFVVMMLNIKLVEINENILRYLPIGGLIGLIFLVEVFFILDSDLIPVLQIQKEFSYPFSVSSGFFLFFLSLLFIINSVISIITFQKGLFTCLENFQNFRLESNSLFQNFSVSYDQGAIIQEQFINPLSFLQWSNLITPTSNIESLGQLIYTYYFYYFLMASLILLVAMIGAIVLTMHKGVDVKRQEVFEQNTREFTKTVQKLEIV